MFRVIGAEIQLAAFIVFYFRRALGHNLVKDKVNGRQHFLTAAEILFHGDELIPVSFSRHFGETCILCLKQRGVSQTETVDALLHITYGKEVVPSRDKV